MWLNCGLDRIAKPRREGTGAASTNFSAHGSSAVNDVRGYPLRAQRVALAEWKRGYYGGRLSTVPIMRPPNFRLRYL